MRTPGHQLLYFILLATAIHQQTIYGQAIRSHYLCVDGMVNVSVNSTGLLHHVQRDSSVSPCTLLLSGFVNGSYVYIPGVNLYTAGCGLSTNITINNAMYCVEGNQSTNTAMMKVTSDQLNITLPSADAQNFTVQYYNNIGVCGKSMALPERAEVNQLSGVISTSLDDPPKGSNDCEVRLRGLPSPPVYVRFNLLYTTDLPYPLYIGDKNFSHTTPGGSTLLVTTSSERSIDVIYLPDDNSFIAFVLTFSVVHCGDIPAVPNTTNTTTDTPWLPDANVTYACVDGWELKSDTESNIECRLNRTTEIAEWSDHSNIRCIPEPWCHLPPTSVANSDYTLSGDNQTATYQCIDGYTTNSSVPDITINCTSSDSDTTPWTWTSANFRCDVEPWCHLPPTSVANSDYKLGGDNLTATYHCIDGYTTNSSVPDRTINCTSSDGDATPWTWTFANFQCAVECELTAEYQNITNGEVTNNSYYYTQQLQYQCDVGYVRYVVVNCTKYGNWSALPSCVPAPTTTTTTTTATSGFIGSSQSGITATNTTTSTSEWIGSSQSEINATTTTTTTISATKLMSAGGLGKEHIMIIAGVGGLVVLAAVVLLTVYFCIRKTQSAKSQSKRDLTDSTAAVDGIENPYHDLEPPDVIPTTDNQSAGAYNMVVLDDSNQYAEVSAPATRAKPKPPNNKPSSRPVEEPQSDVYAELKGNTALKAPKRHVPLFTSTEPVYDEAPALPAKLGEVVFEENTLYEGYGAAAQTTSQQAGNQSNVEMVDNTLYERY